MTRRPIASRTLGTDPALAAGKFHGVLAHGCETGKDAPPAMVLSESIAGADGGVTVVCMPLDDAYVQNTAVKLGVGVALARSETGIAKSPDFPAGDVAQQSLRGEPKLANFGDRTWALARFDVPELTGISVVTALDVTDVQWIIRKNLAFALLVLLFAAGVSVAFGSSIASLMSRALGRVNVALKKLALQEYVHVDAIRTGDELDDLAAGFNKMVNGLIERDKLKTTMGKYMTASVMDRLLSGKVQLGGETLTVTILFSDIRSFTTISEKMNAQELVGLLNEYFTEMVGLVMDGDGVVDKYIGDAIMAVFGAPVPKPDDAKNAVIAAVRMRQGLRVLNKRLAARGVPELRTGIGIHTGEVVAGNIGSEQAHGVHRDRRRGEPGLAAREQHQGPRRARAHQRGHLEAGEGRRRDAAREGDHREGTEAAGDDVRSARRHGRAADRRNPEGHGLTGAPPPASWP